MTRPSRPNDETTAVARHGRALRRALAGAGVAALLALFVPAPTTRPLGPASRAPFAWHQDERWRALEASFRRARATGCTALAAPIADALESGRRRIGEVRSRTLEPTNPLLADVERTVFELGPMVAACPASIPEYVELVAAMRSAVKAQSRSWDVGSPVTRDALYRLLYGGRAAVEEAMLQAPAGSFPELVQGDDEPSSTPAAEVLGVRVHSGDILLSRGGAPTSALIARGNDYPGNFSHVALAYVDGGTGEASLVEAHIERGVAVASLPEYLRDTKLRVMVLRPRADLPALAADPRLPHEAAEAAWREARARHIPYDFAMDTADHSRMFCSEVASAAYGRFGVTLWMGLSHISSPGLARWLAGFGVRNFETQEPSDLEYDPQLAVVAEWRDAEALRADHLDNAVTDALLEGAEAGESLPAPLVLLPVVRLAKLYSLVLNAFGAVGPVPEGLSASGALRTRGLTSLHGRIRERLTALAQEFRARNGYFPPYWELVALARTAKAETEGAR